MLLDPGKYRGRIRDYGVTQSQAGQQHPTVFITFELLGQYDPTTGELGPCPTTSRTYYKAVTEKTIGWLLADLKAIGYDRPGLEYLDPEAPGAADLFEREIDVACEHEAYQGQARERSPGWGPSCRWAPSIAPTCGAGAWPTRRSTAAPTAACGDSTSVKRSAGSSRSSTRRPCCAGRASGPAATASSSSTARACWCRSGTGRAGSSP
jgi:hypothetical protein